MKTKTMAILSTLMIALSLAGVAYAHWYDVIYINGEVKMGELIFGFTEQYGSYDGKMRFYDFTKLPLVFDIIYPEPKPVGEVECRLDTPETSVHLDPPKTVYKRMYIEIRNAYPEYVAWCEYSLDNGGTIPLDVINYCVIINSGDGLTYGWVDVDGDGYGDYIEATNADGDAVINIWFVPLFLGQIDPCNHVDQGIYIHIKEPAEECHTYTFEITIHASQWDP